MYELRYCKKEPSETSFSGFLVLIADVYKDKNGPKHFGLQVVRYLYRSTRGLKMICCLTGCQWRYFKVGMI